MRQLPAAQQVAFGGSGGHRDDANDACRAPSGKGDAHDDYGGGSDMNYDYDVGSDMGYGHAHEHGDYDGDGNGGDHSGVTGEYDDGTCYNESGDVHSDYHGGPDIDQDDGGSNLNYDEHDIECDEDHDDHVEDQDDAHFDPDYEAGGSW